MSKVFKKLSALALVLTLAIGASGCRDEDVVAGVIIGGVIGGVVAGGGVQVGVGSPSYSYLSDCEGYNREWICDWHAGGWYRSQRRYYAPQPPPYHPPHHWAAIESASVAAAPAADLKASEIQKRFALDASASTKLASAIENAKGGDLKAFDSIGLGLSEMNTLMSKNSIDINDLDSVAAKLNTTSERALAVLNAFTKEYNTQKSDVHSAMWSQCQSKGHWKTPQTASCSALSEKGCSPAAGASSCLSL